MKSIRSAFAWLLATFVLVSAVRGEDATRQSPAKSDLAAFRTTIKPFLATHCLDCHTGAEAEAEFRLDDVDGDLTSGRDTERWEKTLEMLDLGAMPPEEAETRPDKHERRRVVAWITTELRKIGRGPDPARLARPEFGNRVDHEDLFSGEHTGPAYSPSRLWRKNPQIHRRFERALRLKPANSPFSPKGGHGFQDYGMLLADKSTIEALRINAQNYLAEILDGRLVNPKGEDGKPDKTRLVREGRSRWREFNELAQSEDPTSEQRTQAVRRAFEVLFDRPPTAQEQERYEGFLTRSMELGGGRLGLASMMEAMILSPDFVYRQEIGLGPELPDGRRMLAPEEIAQAIAFALTDSPPDDELRKAVAEDRLSTTEDVEREVRRMLAASTRQYWDYEINHTFQSHYDACPNPRVLRFFREFFGYDRVFDVFKDKTRNPDHKPQFLFKDADLFVLAILEEDRNVLARLLTSDRYVVHYVSKERGEKKLAQMRKDPKKNSKALEILASGRTPILGGYRGGNYFTAYGLDRETWDYPIEQPFVVENRAGMLTHPAWLVAHSGNFDTDPIRRGKWIREHLLAGVIPEIPIGVDAAIDDDPHQTIRERIAKTTDSKCWRCHKMMNPLGLPFESFDDFGRFREHVYRDQDGKVVPTFFERQRLLQLSKQRNRPKYTFTPGPLDTTGALTGTGDPALDVDVDDAFDLVHRLAKSDHARQSFVRHAFRYWMGRNETMNDSPTLIAADNAYVESDGSFEELLVALLTSDSFLMRKDE